MVEKPVLDSSNGQQKLVRILRSLHFPFSPGAGTVLGGQVEPGRGRAELAGGENQ